MPCDEGAATNDANANANDNDIGGILIMLQLHDTTAYLHYLALAFQLIAGLD